MYRLRKSQINALRKKGIDYEIPCLTITDANTGKQRIERYFDDETGREERDVHVGRMHVASPTKIMEGKVPSDWEVTPEGDLYNKMYKYRIEKERLAEKNWVVHMMAKRWINLNSFVPTYLKACRKAGLEEISVLTDGI